MHCSIRYADYFGLLDDPREHIEQSSRHITLQRIFYVRQRQYTDDALHLYSEWCNTQVFHNMNRWARMSRFMDEKETFFLPL
jgi:hypothetical protein